MFPSFFLKKHIKRNRSCGFAEVEGDLGRVLDSLEDLVFKLLEEGFFVFGDEYSLLVNGCRWGTYAVLNLVPPGGPRE